MFFFLESNWCRLLVRCAASSYANYEKSNPSKRRSKRLQEEPGEGKMDDLVEEASDAAVNVLSFLRTNGIGDEDMDNLGRMLVRAPFNGERPQ